MKHQPTLIIFTGLPCTGKTTLSRKAAQLLQLPLLAKDALKEIMFDQIGTGDKAWSGKLAHATFGIMDYVIAQQLRAGHSLIIESNYSPNLASQQFQAWQKEYNYRAIQVVCRSDIPVLAQRHYDRRSKDRHPGHVDDGDVAAIELDFRRRVQNREDQPLDIPGEVHILDTTILTADTGAEILTHLKMAMNVK